MASQQVDPTQRRLPHLTVPLNPLSTYLKFWVRAAPYCRTRLTFFYLFNKNATLMARREQQAVIEQEVYTKRLRKTPPKIMAKVVIEGTRQRVILGR